MRGKQLRQLEAELWKAADQLRANSKLTASEYSMPVLGLIFLCHAYNRFLKVKEEIELNLPVHPERGKRTINKNDFVARNAMYLPEIAQFDYLVDLPEKRDCGEALNEAMKAIEAEYDSLQGVLPKNYNVVPDNLLRGLLRTFNEDALRKAEGDVFGKIYEYFLNKFAMTGAQEGGEFFTPFSLVNTIVNVIEPDHGTVLDPAVGSAGMFVQTGYFIESEGLKPAEKVTFYGQEKAETNTRLAKMNLTVHGLEGSILEGNTFYEDKHDLIGECDFVMANPPFNVNAVDKDHEVVKKDPRLPFGLPRNDNANYLWIQYFYSYLKPTGRAGFVMASSASDAGHSEKDIREKLIKTGAVDVMLAIGSNFFYTRSLPCTLWFFDRAKEQDKGRSQKILMLDARKIYHVVNQKIHDFSPEQLQNLICVVQLYRGNSGKFHQTVKAYLETSAQNAIETATILQNLMAATEKLQKQIEGFVSQLEIEGIEKSSFHQPNTSDTDLLSQLTQLITDCHTATADMVIMESIATQCKHLRKPLDKMLKALYADIATGVKDHQLNKNKDWNALNVKNQLNNIKEYQALLCGNPDEEEPGLLHDMEYFWKQAHWLINRFPDGIYTDIEGLCKVVTLEEVAAKDYSLSPGRYVGVDAGTDDDFDYEERLREIHLELAGLNEEAEQLVKAISDNYKELL